MFTHLFCTCHFLLGDIELRFFFFSMYLRGYGSAGKHQIVHDHSLVKSAKELDHAYTDFKIRHKKKSTDKVLRGETAKKTPDGNHLSLCYTGEMCYSKTSHQSVEKASVAYNVSCHEQTSSSHFPLLGDTGLSGLCPQRKKRVSSINKKGRQPRTTKKNNRNTDHIYNTRKAKPAGETVAKRLNNRDTDHMYNLRKADVEDPKIGKAQNNRDTDHMYNMRKINAHRLHASATKSDPASVKRNEAALPVGKSEVKDLTSVDRRAVDKDHMYQHSVRKNRNKLEHKGSDVKPEFHPSCTAVKKRKALEANDTSHPQNHNLTKERAAGIENSAPPSKLFRPDSKSTVCSSRQTRSANQETTSQQTMCSVITDLHTVSDPMFGLDRLEVKLLQDSSDVVTSSIPGIATTFSPVHSDNDSDHVCEDDSRMTGVWHTDHMYVHADYLDNNILENKVQPVLNQCFSAEGYKQEHSYANSEELHYDACVNCSELVQQLIGTIRQQGDQIEELKKKLRAANTKIKQLSNIQIEDVE